MRNMNNNLNMEKFNIKKYMNSKLMFCYTLTSVILFMAYIFEFFKGNRTIGYTAIFIFILLIPLITSIVLYKKNSESDMVRMIAVYGYNILCIFVLWTSVTNQVFVYIFPILIAISMYGDRKFTLKVGAITILNNIIYVVYNCVIGNAKSIDIVNYEIQIAIVFVLVFFSYIITKALEVISIYRIGLVKDEKVKVDGVLEKVISIADNLSTNISSINGEAKQIAEQGENNSLAIDQIVDGTGELAKTVQNQLIMSENINKLTESVSELIIKIKEEFEVTRENTNEGNRNMVLLENASEKSREVSKEVDESMGELIKNTGKLKKY